MSTRRGREDDGAVAGGLTNRASRRAGASLARGCGRCGGRVGVPGDADGSSRSARARRMWNLGETPTHAETVRSASSDASAVDGAGARRRGDAVHDERPAETRAEAGDDSRATSSRPPTRRRRRSRIAADATASPARMLKSRIARGDVWGEGGRTTRRTTSTHTSDSSQRQRWFYGTSSASRLSGITRATRGGRQVMGVRSDGTSRATTRRPAHTRTRSSRVAPPSRTPYHPAAFLAPAPSPQTTARLDASPTTHRCTTPRDAARSALFPTSSRERHLDPVTSATPSR